MGRLNLKDGPNKVAFSVTTQYQDTCCCKATMYLWNWNDKVVISDINSIITNSDALGHILPHLGKDWTHHGIAKPFHKIHLHGYKFLCCSARPVLEARITKGYPKWINEQGCALPRSPSLFSASRSLGLNGGDTSLQFSCLLTPPVRMSVLTSRWVCLRAASSHSQPQGRADRELMKNLKSRYEQLAKVMELIFLPLGQEGRMALLRPECSHFVYWRPPPACH